VVVDMGSNENVGLGLKLPLRPHDIPHAVSGYCCMPSMGEVA